MSLDCPRTTPTDPRESGPQRRARLAAEGQYGELLAEQERSCPSLLDPEELWDLIRLASRTKAHDDPVAFSRSVLDETAGFVAFLALRSQDALRNRLAAHDRGCRDHGLTGPPPDLEGRALDALLKLQAHLAALLEARATLERRWQTVETGGRSRPKSSGPPPHASASAARDTLANAIDAGGHDGCFGRCLRNDHGNPHPNGSGNS